jgi:hypothetical protein
MAAYLHHVVHGVTLILLQPFSHRCDSAFVGVRFGVRAMEDPDFSKQEHANAGTFPHHPEQRTGLRCQAMHIAGNGALEISSSAPRTSGLFASHRPFHAFDDRCAQIAIVVDSGEPAGGCRSKNRARRGRPPLLCGLSHMQAKDFFKLICPERAQSPSLFHRNWKEGVITLEPSSPEGCATLR